jgi:hypothetical protein
MRASSTPDTSRAEVRANFSAATSASAVLF